VTSPITKFLLRPDSLEKAFLSCIYTILLVVLYQDAVFPSFSYMGFMFYGIPWGILSLQLVVIALVATQLPNSFRNTSDVFIWMLFSIVFIPTVCMPALVINKINPEQLAVLFLLIVMSFLSMVYTSRVKIRANLPYCSPYLFWLFIIALSSLFIVFILKDYGLSFGRLFDIRNYAEIYDIRHAAREQKEAASAISNYGLLWLAKVIIPLILGWSLVKKVKLITMLAVFMQISLFAITAHKSFLFSLVFVYFIYWVSKRENSGLIYFRVMAGLVIFSALLFYLLDFDLVVSIIVRRVFMVPGMLSGYFFEFYTLNPFAYYGNSFLSGIVDSAYATSPAFTIGLNYLQSDKASANVNFWGDAYAHLGFIGVLLISFIVNLIILVVNACSWNKNRLIALCLMAIPFWTLMESSLTTTLVSHGLGFSIILLVLMNKEKDIES